MKKLFKNFIALSLGLISSSPVLLLASCNNKTDIFDCRDNVLYGFRNGVTDQEIHDGMIGGLLRFPSSIVEIADNAFYDAINDKSKLPDFVKKVGFDNLLNLTRIGENAFRKCPINDRDFFIFSNLNIGKNAFAYSEDLENISIIDPDGPVLSNNSEFGTIEERAFYNCPKVKSIDLGKNADVRDEVFANLPMLTEITFSNCGEAEINWSGRNVFKLDSGERENLRVAFYGEFAEEKQIDFLANNGITQDAYKLDCESMNFTSICGYVGDKIGETKIKPNAQGFADEKEYRRAYKIHGPRMIVSKFTTVIGEKAFYDETKEASLITPTLHLETLDLNNGGSNTMLSEIQTKAFYAGNFENLILPASLTKIGDNAFSNAKITSIDISAIEDKDTLTSWSDGCFSGLPDKGKIIVSDTTKFTGDVLGRLIPNKSFDAEHWQIISN